jgi:hypothetical protein
VPTRLDPPLRVASGAKPVITRNGCHSRHAGVSSPLCIYGDRKSHTAIVLFGDSHAAAWFPALDLIARQRHWRLVVITKAGCPPAEVNVVRGGLSYGTCPRWRTNMKVRIAKLHPALVIAATASYHEEPAAQPMPDVPTGHGSAWQDGWAAMFSFLRHTARHVLFISDVPTLLAPAPACISSHPSDVRQCNTKRSAAIPDPAVKSQEITLAEREGVHVIDPISWFCARTACPVIVDHIVVYRDTNHMTPPWSRYIAPVLAEAVTPIVRGRASASR